MMQQYRYSVIGLSLGVGWLGLLLWLFVLPAAAQNTDPLPMGCIRNTPAGQPAPACCASGFVYLNGIPVEDAEVTIQSITGTVVVYTQRYLGTESRPYYHVNLSAAPLDVEPGDPLTITARYSYLEKTRHHIVKSDGQQVDLVLAREAANTLALVAEGYGYADAGKLDYPRDVDVDSQGNLYVLDSNNYRILVFRPDGTFLRAWGEPGSAKGRFGTLLALALDSSDNVYVVEYHRIQKFTSEGDFLLSWGKTGTQNGDFVAATDIAIDTNNHIYVVDVGTSSVRTDRVQKFDTDGKWLTSWDGSGEISGSLTFTNPVAIDVDHAGQVYVFDAGNQLVRKFTGEGEQVGVWGRPEFAINSWVGLAVDESHVYITISNHHQVLKFTLDGSFVMRFGSTPGAAIDQFWNPIGIVVTGDHLYVADTQNHRIQQLSTTGNFWGSIGQKDDGYETLMGPSGIYIDSEGNRWVVDSVAQRVKLFSSDNQLLGSWAGFAPTTNELEGPIDIDRVSNGDFFVANWGGHKLQRFRFENGELHFTGEWTSSVGCENSQFAHPSGLTIDRDDHIFVTDFDNNRIYKLKMAGDILQCIVSWNHEFNHPQRVAVDGQNHVFVTDSYNHRVQRFLVIDNIVTHEITWGSKGTADGQFEYPSEIIWKDNAIYVLDAADTGRIQRFTVDGVYQPPTFGGSTTAPGKFNARAFAFHGEQIVAVGTGRVQEFATLTYSVPIATFMHLSTLSLGPTDKLVVTTLGQPSDVNKSVQSYKLTSNKVGLLRDEASDTMTIPAQELGRGLHRLELQACDDQQCSTPAQIYVYVADRQIPTAAPTPTLTTTPAPNSTVIPTPTPTLAPGVTPSPTPTPTATRVRICPEGPLYTMLLYLTGDYDDNNALVNDYERFLLAPERLDSLTNPCVQMAIQIDGGKSINGGAPDTYRYIWKYNAGLRPGAEQLPEQFMNVADTLTDFIAWGQQEAPAPYYYLAIADHGDGMRISFDLSNTQPNQNYLRASDIQKALKSERIEPIHILHLDACSMALLDVGYQLREQVQYLIASQYLGWNFFAYEEYAAMIGATTHPDQLARQIVDRYHALAADRQLPHTIAAWRLNRMDAVNNGVDELAKLLRAWVGNDDQSQSRYAHLLELREASQQFDSDTSYDITPLDSYVDLLDWATKVRDNPQLSEALRQAATTLVDELSRADGIILWSQHGSGRLPDKLGIPQNISLTNAHGVSIYYPLEGEGRLPLRSTSSLSAGAQVSYTQVYADYIDNQLFDFTLASRWDEFLRTAYGIPTATTDLEQPQPPLAPLDTRKMFYLPLIQR